MGSFSVPPLIDRAPRFADLFDMARGGRPGLAALRRSELVGRGDDASLDAISRVRPASGDASPSHV
jgi:hypothetical protein